jgi:hypothetical protein
MLSSKKTVDKTNKNKKNHGSRFRACHPVQKLTDSRLPAAAIFFLQFNCLPFSLALLCFPFFMNSGKIIFHFFVRRFFLFLTALITVFNQKKYNQTEDHWNICEPSQEI